MISGPIQRRAFITLLGGAAAAWPLAATTQQLAVPVVGFLSGASAWEYAHLAAALRQGLAETGYVDGRNVLVEYRWAEGHYERLPALAAELVRRPVSIIAAVGGPPPALAAKAATSNIPIIFNMGLDPVAAGLVASLSRPGGNLTGVSSMNSELAPKRLELLRETVPTVTTVAMLVNPANPNAEALTVDLQAAARALGLVPLQVLRASTERDLDTAFATLAQLRVGALLIGGDPFFISRSERLAALALRTAMPTIFQAREFVAAGGLMSYGGSIKDEYRIVGTYVGRILKGEKPADLPVQQATRIELIINLKTAKTLGVTMPTALLVRADEVIE